MSLPIRVLVVDDSAFARKVVREVLSRDPEIEVVGIARDGLDAVEKIRELEPDVVTLDLVMPHLDGVEVLHALRGRPRPRCVVVSTADEHSPLAIKALQAGAIDVVHKPTALATERLYELSAELVQKVKIAAAARLPLQSSTGEAYDVRAAGSAIEIVVIGTSTGGPQALTRLFGALPRDFPVPIVAVVHMPVGYTKALAERLNADCRIAVVEAYDGALLRPGLAVIGQAGRHIKIVGEPREARVKLDVLPLDTLHRPAVDVLFASAAQIYGRNARGVVLTGMGEDGLQGSRAIHAAGGSVLAEAESSCVVYGMPRAVIEAGVSKGSVPLEAMAAALLWMP
ncbi:MAG: chemotaxis-specific protein-glutamate methyltransferase CheB [Polyangiaceae bacterium]